MDFDNKAMWHELAGGNTEVGQWFQHGYSEFVQCVVPVIVRENNPNTQGENASFVAEAVADLVGTSAVEEVTHLRDDCDEVRVIAPLTVAVQASGKKRLCWNGRPINQYLPKNSFKMEHAEKAARMMRKNDWMFTLDMKSGYHQCPVKPWFRKFLCFQHEGKVYRFRSMPFGLSTAPRAYTKLAHCLLKRWRSLGIRCSNYIDDFIFFAPTLDKALEIRALVLRDLARLGWFISASKSMLRPGTMVEYLGLVLCSLPEPHVRIPVHKVERAKALFAGVLKKVGSIGSEGVRRGDVRMQGHKLASALGFLQSLRLAVSLVPVFTRELYVCLNNLPRLDEGFFEYGQSVAMSEGAVAECRFWQACIERWNGFVLPPLAVGRIVYTDGSGAGYGALVHRVLNRQVEPALQVVAGSWEQVMSTDFVMTELQGLWRVVVALGKELMGQTVLHRTDSISTYAVVRHGGSAKSERLTAIVRRLQVYCMLFNITLASQYVGSQVIINSGADLLSRSADVSDGARLNPKVFAKLWSLWGPFAVDMFASMATVQCNPSGRQLPYWSLLADGVSEGVDAFTGDWRGKGTLYAFPPVKLVGETLQLLLEQRVRAVLVAPKWPAQWWWPVLLGCAKIAPVSLSAIHAANVEGPLFVPGRRDLPTHPLGPSF